MVISGPGEPGKGATAGRTARAVFEDAHGRFGPWVHRRFVERCGRSDIAEDLSQRTWAAVWRALDTGVYDPRRAAISTFVHAVSQNVWRQWTKSAGAAAGRMAAGEPPDTPAIDDGPAAVVAEAELIEAVRACVDGRAGGAIGPEEAQTLRLLATGATDRDLAAALGVAPSTANARKRAALDRLRAYLAKFAPGAERRGGGGE
ncbi:MAG: RNA polymerase sigma factor [Phycisphaeraceae bacterium]|nr:RNA polymerase sigma factor [Phycisphaeraceae bacterium]